MGETFQEEEENPRDWQKHRGLGEMEGCRERMPLVTMWEGGEDSRLKGRVGFMLLIKE
jgi:hypothetical protein